MPSPDSIAAQLEGNSNWALVSNRKNVLRGLEKIMGDDEKIVDVLDGLYRGSKLSSKGDLPGVLVATDRRLLFVTSELSRPLYEEIATSEIRGIAYERAFSSIVMTLRLKSSPVTFKTFDNRAAVTKFIDAASAAGVTAPAREEETLRLLDEVSATIQSLAKMNESIGADRAEPDDTAAPPIPEKRLRFLYREAKKIHETFAGLVAEAGDIGLREALTDDIIILASLCAGGDRALADDELAFIAMVLMPLDEYGDFFAGDDFPAQRWGEIAGYRAKIAGHLRRAAPGKDLEGFSLKTMNLLENFDREKGTSLSDRAGSALHTFAQCLIKADGSVSPEEEERLKSIYRLITRGAALSSTAVAVKEAEEEETLDQVMEKINALVGMDKIKGQIATLVNLIKVQKEREERKLPVTPLTLHAVFSGPPGTGKTTIARLLGRVYRCLGILQKGQLVETDRAGLVAGYVGQTAINVDSVVQKALDGVLFIDEAYALVPDDIGGRDFGHEAVNTIIKRMEDYRDRLVVIVAGYPDEMERFIQSNPGLKSRFSRYFYFDHYPPEDLIRIFDLFCKNVRFSVDKDARSALLDLLKSLYEKRDRTFGNGRLVRNIFEMIVERQANRIAGITPLTDEILCTIRKDDIPGEADIGL
ncbi:MAG: AAA family ATPase [Spirochaetes bacterium]|nr:AAA family ATPase [Spirochaetota bacterium]